VRMAASISARCPLDRAGGAQDTGKGMRGGGGATPLGQSTQGTLSGEVTGQGSVGRLGERVPIQRVPGARQNAGSQSTLERGRKEQNKREGLHARVHRHRIEAGGAVSEAGSAVSFQAKPRGCSGV
jgi:hypothetical protein